MNLQTFFTSQRGTGLAMSLGRNLPPSLGNSLVRLIIPLITIRKSSDLVRNISGNQSVARGMPSDAPELNKIVKEVLLNAGLGYYDLYHRLGQGFDAIKQAINFDPKLFSALDEAEAAGQGVVLVGPHLCNFDLGLLALAIHGYPIQVLSYAAPPGGYELQNDMRTRAGCIVTPASSDAAKKAIARLQAGGIVATGVDRPAPELTKKVQFFGRPAPLPTGYTKLALSTNAKLLLLSMRKTGPGSYYIWLATPIELTRTGNRQRDATSNTERLLAEAAKLIQAQPSDWMMFHPIWSD